MPSYYLWWLNECLQVCHIVVMERILYAGCELRDEGKGARWNRSLEGQFYRLVWAVMGSPNCHTFDLNKTGTVLLTLIWLSYGSNGLHNWYLTHVIVTWLSHVWHLISHRRNVNSLTLTSGRNCFATTMNSKENWKPQNLERGREYENK